MNLLQLKLCNKNQEVFILNKLKLINNFKKINIQIYYNIMIINKHKLLDKLMNLLQLK